MELIQHNFHAQVITKISKDFDAKTKSFNRQNDKQKKTLWFTVMSLIFDKSKKVCECVNMYVNKKSRIVVDEIKHHSKKFKLNEEDLYMNVSL
jgi:hypothetical protein